MMPAHKAGGRYKGKERAGVAVPCPYGKQQELAQKTGGRYEGKNAIYCGAHRENHDER